MYTDYFVAGKIVFDNGRTKHFGRYPLANSPEQAKQKTAAFINEEYGDSIAAIQFFLAYDLKG